MTTTRTVVDVAVIGGGLSGSLAAVQLLRQGRGLRVALVDREGRFGRGVAYATKASAHLLNVPAGRMGAFPEDPGAFVRWLGERGFEAGADAFVPRALYGRYVAELLEETALEATRTGGGTLIRIARRAMRVSGGAGAAPATVEIEGGMRLTARAVVLALGNFAPRDPDVDGLDEVNSADRYRRDPWEPRALQGLGPDEPVLLLGTGLTMIDVCLALDERGHRGTIHALSPRGLLPLPHRAGVKPVAAPDLSGPATVRNLLRRVREGIRAAEERGDDWRAVLDALRPSTAALWASLPIAERRRFLRHARRYWDRHRHRIAPEAAETLVRMGESGKLRIHAGRLDALFCDGKNVVSWFRVGGSDQRESVRVARIINCTGPSTDLRSSRDPLLSSLRATGRILPDALGLGLATAADGAVLRGDGTPDASMFAIGPLRRGDLWESTAAPEIRTQAAALAGLLAERLGVAASTAVAAP